MKFTGSNVLITGASKGIGAQIAKTLASFGLKVWINYRSGAEAAEAIKEEVGSATLLAAGNVDRDASVTSWKSSGFSFETPEEVRGIVSELLRQHSGEVRDAWAK